MNEIYPVRNIRCGTILASAMALALCGPVVADGTGDNSLAASDDASNTSHAADNSARNKDDSNGTNLTPLDQSSKPGDIDITRNIRQHLVDDETLGTNAENVKVITIDGNVTMRGAVANATDHAKVIAVAKAAAGTGQVQDELEVIDR